MDSNVFHRWWRVGRIVAALAIGGLIGAQHIGGQGFISGSDGSDGPLNLTTAGTFDLSSLGKDPDGDNVYQFTTINIANGVTLTVSGQKINGPVVFLAQGDAVVAGTIDLQGAKGHLPTVIPSERLPSVPGAGGFPGGAGGDSINAAQPGGGPAGGTAGNGSQNSAHGGFASGNTFLIPLIGGSGGGGQRAGTNFGGGGGAGGGAILIASSTSINVTGSILANGGDAGDPSCNCTNASFGSGAGAGGAIRLVAPVMRGNGNLSVQPGFGRFGAAAGAGIVRLEAFQHLEGLNATIRASPTALALGPHPTLRVARIGGIALPSNPTGSFAVPDVVINTPLPVSVDIEARNIPLGTAVTLFIFSESGPDLIVDAPGVVLGGGGLLTTSVNVTFPTGYSRGFAKAKYTQVF